MNSWFVFLVILLMALTTYFTRIAGYLAVQKWNLSPRAAAFMDLLPGCVLIAIIAPAFATHQPANLIGLAITVLAASRFGLLPTILIAIASTGLLLWLFPN